MTNQESNQPKPIIKKETPMAKPTLHERLLASRANIEALINANIADGTFKEEDLEEIRASLLPSPSRDAELNKRIYHFGNGRVRK